MEAGDFVGVKQAGDGANSFSMRRLPKLPSAGLTTARAASGAG